MSLKSKAGLTFTIFVLLFSVVIGRSFYIQILSHDKLKAYSNSQFLRTAKVYPNRGQIFDRNGSPLAINVQRYNLYTVTDNHELMGELKVLKSILPEINTQELKKKVSSRRKFTWLARNVAIEPNHLSIIRKMQHIQVEAQPARYYPNNELLSQLIGFVNVDNSGLSGVEYTFNDELKGKAKITRYMKDAKGRAVKHETLNHETTSQDLHLSIDKDIQAVVEAELKKAYDHHKARIVGGGVMDAYTGEMWAIANYPGFDPNYPQASKRENQKLSFITDPFEPGSLFKTFTIMAGLEQGVINESSKYYCEKGSMKVGKHTIKEAQGKKHEWLDISEILEVSSNIGTTKVAFDIGGKRLLRYFETLGLNQKTGVEMAAESRGIFPSSGELNDIKLSNISFGQGIAITPIQAMQAFAPVVNGGYLVKPTLIKGNISKEKKQVLNAHNAELMQNFLINVVEKGSGKRAQIQHFFVGGKTSTAQRASPEGGYSGYTSGFIGFVSHIQKPFIIFIYIDDPKESGIYGGEIAAPVFQKVARAILYKNKEFSGLTVSQEKSHSQYIDKISISSAATQSSRLADKGYAPDFIGLDKESSYQLAEKYGYDLEIQGFGICYKQSVPLGSPIPKNNVIKLYFKPPTYDE